MSIAKNLMIDLLNNEDVFFNKYNYFFNNYSNHFVNDNEVILDLPHLDLSKLNTYIENNHLIIKYDNPNDIRRKSYYYSLYVGDSNVKVSYDNGFLKIEKEEKAPERKIIEVNVK